MAPIHSFKRALKASINKKFVVRHLNGDGRFNVDAWLLANKLNTAIGKLLADFFISKF